MGGAEHAHGVLGAGWGVTTSAFGGGTGVFQPVGKWSSKEFFVDLIWNELLFLLFNGLLFFLPNQKSTTTSDKHIPVVSWIFRFETVVPGPNPRLGAGLILDGFGSSKPSRISGCYDSDCVTYTLNIYSYIIYESNCAHLASFFLSPKVIYRWTFVSKQKTKELKKLRVEKEKQKHSQFCYRLVLPSCWCLKIGPFGMEKTTSYATALTPGWSGVESTVHRPGLGMMKLSPSDCLKMKRDRMRGIWNRNIFDEYCIRFYMETINEQLYISYIMSMIHHLNSNAFLISWYVYIYID